MSNKNTEIYELRRILDLVYSNKKSKEHYDSDNENYVENEYFDKLVSSRQNSIRGGEKQSITVKFTPAKMKNKFKVSYFKDVIGFMDLKGILDLSLVNKEFNYFVNSVFTLTKIYQNKLFIDKLAERHKKVAVKTYSPKKKPKVEDGAIKGFFTGFASLIGFNSKPITPASPEKDNLKTCQLKVNLYDKILKAKLLNIEISRTIKESQAELNQIKDTQLLKKTSNRTTTLKRKYTDDKLEDFEHIKYDTLTKEIESIKKEINELISMQDKVKLEYKSHENKEIESSKLLSSLNFYLKTNMDIEAFSDNIGENKVVTKSGKYKEIDTGGLSTIAFFNDCLENS